MGGKVGENPAALRAAVFSLASKNLRGRSNAPPPKQGAVNTFPSAKNKKEKKESFVCQQNKFPLRT